METIHHKNEDASKKLPEIGRFLQFKKSQKLKYKHIEASTGIPERTISKYVHENTPIGVQLLRSLIAVYGLSLDWLLTGQGHMFIGDDQVSEPAADYASDEPLIPHHEQADMETLQDYWWLVAKSIEQSMMQSGAKARVDYSVVDLYQMAQPFVFDQYKEKGLDITVYGK